MKMLITNITCNAPCSGVQDDNVFLLVQADAGPPMRYPPAKSYPMGTGDTMPLPVDSDTGVTGYSVNYDYAVIVQAFDLDSRVFTDIDQPDYLFNISADTQTPSGTTKKYNHNSAVYSFTVEFSQ